MLYSNSLSYQRSSYGSGLSSAGGKNIYFNNNSKTIQIHTSDQVDDSTSFPNGYRAGTAILLPLIDGGISGRISTESASYSDIIGYGLVSGTLNITITTNADGDLLANIDGTLTISITTSGLITAIGYVAGTLDIGAKPSADDIAQAVWQMQLPGGFSSGSAGRLLSSVGAASDPWAITLPGTYAAGEAGNILGNLLLNIPASVWDELKNSHTTASSYGKIIQDLETLAKQIKGLTSAQM